MSTPVVEGDDRRTLRGAAGHLPDTPRPWEPGNSAIAAHRDGLFRPLARVRIGDDVVVRTPTGVLHYMVKRTRVVRPTDLSVLKATAPHMLTLITCYPFNHVGSAPRRFIVQAERVEPGAVSRRGGGLESEPAIELATKEKQVEHHLHRDGANRQPPDPLQLEAWRSRQQ